MFDVANAERTGFCDLLCAGDLIDTVGMAVPIIEVNSKRLPLSENDGFGVQLHIIGSPSLSSHIVALDSYGRGDNDHVIGSPMQSFLSLSVGNITPFAVFYSFGNILSFAR